MPDRNVTAPYPRGSNQTEVSPTIISSQRGYRGESFQSSERPGESADDLFAPMPGVVVSIPFTR